MHPGTADRGPARDLPLPGEESARAGGPVTVAHRGASAYAPENTLAAVDAAARLGVTWVENDVQRTRDGELVVLHDTTLERTTDVRRRFPGRAPWNVGDFTLAEIATLDAGGWFGAGFAGARVPTLRDFLRRLTEHRQSLLLEIKSPRLYPGIERQILAELREEGWLDADNVRHRLVVQSFDAHAVRAVRALRPDVKTGFLGTPAIGDLPAYAEFADQINPCHRTVSAGYVAAVHALSGARGRPLEVYVWTVDGGPAAVDVARLGVDGVISNTPDAVRDALARACGGPAPAGGGAPAAAPA
ncbi:glycerophosphodiester phosphodiesterase family protein [Streptomyces sp. B1866]|uniref:glycerophosphodiester phosphodiesterase n=1 Tax=Streptomyces sp. B1866 TaxID=3075431 RepID=UPI00288D0BD8|nr:glycerophosphodiester phosphodiesterase family protein [Streptomyces sp. B1866]MDT3397893.1 glycerophosphodiester phosphodiesterase family protein [Streptomyces sp. B1866]